LTIKADSLKLTHRNAILRNTPEKQMTNLTFETKAEAVKFLNDHPKLNSNNSGDSWFPHGTYHLAHGEYSQPDYVPRRYKDGWGIKKISYFYQGTFGAPVDGRVFEI
jgi:hypothetical protein